MGVPKGSWAAVAAILLALAPLPCFCSPTLIRKEREREGEADL